MSFCGVTVTANKLANLPICNLCKQADGDNTSYGAQYPRPEGRTEELSSRSTLSQEAHAASPSICLAALHRAPCEAQRPVCGQGLRDFFGKM